MKGQNKIDYNNYDQINLTVKRQNAEEVILSYGAFLWEKIEEKEDKQYHDILHLSFIRPHKIPNKDRLQLLQVHYEQLINERAVVENKKHAKSQALFATVGAFGFSAILGIIALVFYLTSTFAVVGATAFVVLQTTLAVLLIYKARKVIVKEKESFIFKIEELHGKLEKILLEAKALTGAKDE